MSSTTPGPCSHSLQRPNQPRWRHRCLDGPVSGGWLSVGVAGGDVMACEVVAVVLSLHPQNRPGASHVVEAVLVGVVEVGVGVGSDVEVEEEVVVVDVVVVLGSLQPNHPGVWHVVVL